MSDVLVNVDNVSKRFCRRLKRSLWIAVDQPGAATVHEQISLKDDDAC